MSEESEKTSKAVSVYLSPRAALVLDKYYKNSGFGSMSRTIEEMILSYDKIYTLIMSGLGTAGVEAFFSNPAAVTVNYLTILNNLNLNDGSPFEQLVKRDLQKLIEKRMDMGK
jgi:hypothetical protein